MYLSDAGFTKKRAIILIIILAVVLIVGVVAAIVTNSLLIKRDKERLKKATLLANESYNNLITTKKSQNEDFIESDLFGYTIIVDFGKGYSDYLFMVEKTDEIEYKAKVNYDSESKTIKNKDKSEYKLLAPNGKLERLVKYDLVNPEDYNNTENVYILYGNSRMGFLDRTEFEKEDTDYINEEENYSEEDYPEDDYSYEENDNNQSEQSNG